MQYFYCKNFLFFLFKRMTVVCCGQLSYMSLCEVVRLCKVCFGYAIEPLLNITFFGQTYETEMYQIYKKIHVHRNFACFERTRTRWTKSSSSWSGRSTSAIPMPLNDQRGPTTRALLHSSGTGSDFNYISYI